MTKPKPLRFTILAMAASIFMTSNFAIAAKRACNDALQDAFGNDANTSVVKVQYFKQGEPLVLNEPITAWTPKAQRDLCMVKLNVGPGQDGPAGAPSTTRGIGIEVWLPNEDEWNERIHAWGGGGWAGGAMGSPNQVGGLYAPIIAGREGSVSSTTDTGHDGTAPGQPSSGGDFAMSADGTINREGWKDFSSRSLHEQAVKTKALATFYYGRAPKYSYWDGSSTGGRQALKLAQQYPDDFDGIIANMPAMYWTNFSVASMYAQLVMQRDLNGIPLTEAQLDKVSSAAINACDVVGGVHLGFILDNAACDYDPTQDKQVLCVSSGGLDTSADCVTKIQANVFNKIWYGPTKDGSVPSPAVDNGWHKQLGDNRKWFGLPRGTSLYNAYYTQRYGVNAGWANSGGPWTLSSDQLALQMQNPAIAAPNFINATGNGEDLWKTLSYRQLANAFERGIALQPLFDYINTDNPDLSEFKSRGGKLLAWHGANDEVIPALGSMHYYDTVVKKMGGLSKTQDFYRLFIVPGNGHGPYNGTANPEAEPPSIHSQLFERLVNWVERGADPDVRIDIKTSDAAKVPMALPVCAYPAIAEYVEGDPRSENSYRCQ